MELIIWDLDTLPNRNLDAELILWRSYETENFSKAISIPKLIEKDADLLRRKYLSFIHELSQTQIGGKRLIERLQIRSKFSGWWMTLISEKSNYLKSPEIIDVFRVFAFEHWVVGKSIKALKIVSTNPNLVKSVRLWCEDRGIAFKFELRARKTLIRVPWSRRLYGYLPHLLQAFIWLLLYLAQNWRLRNIGVKLWQKSEGTVTFISYLFNLEPEALSEQKFQSRYWTKLPRELADRGIKTNWLHIFVKDSVLPNSKKASYALEGFNKNEKNLQIHVTLSSFLSVRTVLDTLRDWWRLTKLSVGIEPKLKEIKAFKYLWPMFSHDWKSSVFGKSGMTNLLMFNLFEAALSQLPTQRQGVYLQENQGWEFGFINAWKNNCHGTLVGFPHTTIRFWDLRYFFDHRSFYVEQKHKVPLPDKIACNGLAAFEIFKHGGYSDQMLIKVESLRYLYLEKLAKTIKRKKSSGKSLLVVGDYLMINTHKQLSLLELATAKLKKGTTITFKPHPGCPINPTTYPLLNMLVENKSLEKLMAFCDIVYSSSSTSAAVEPYCIGIPVASILDSSDFNFSPLRGIKGVEFVSKPEKLAAVINNHNVGLDTERVKEYFYLDSSLPKWRNLLMKDSQSFI